MPSLFCMRCKSLTPPGADRCRVCGAPVGDVEGKQHCLTERTFELKAEGKTIVARNKLSAPFFPYEPRESQMDIVNDIGVALGASQHIVMESGTGTGKTICALAGALHHARTNGKKVIYLTRTISQSDHVMRELRNISEVREVSGIAITGRKRSCPLLRTMMGYEDIMPHVLSRLCEEKKAKSVQGGNGGCRFYDRVKSSVPRLEAYCRENFPTSDELDEYCESLDVCPYEARKSLIQGVDVVVAPYVHILSEDIRTNLLAHMKCDDNVVLIVDEAHNLISAARDQGNFSIRMKDLDKAMEEAAALKDPVIHGTLRAGELIGFLRALIKGAANEKITLGTKEALIAHDRIESKIKAKFSMTDNELLTATDRMISIGELRTEYLLDQGTHELSELFKLGVLLKDWVSSDEGQFIKMIRADADGEMLSASCMDPKDITMFIRSLKGAVHMSGTLQPLEQYARTMGLPMSTATRIYPTPFPPENRSVVYVNDVTTKFEDLKREGMHERIAKHIVSLCNAVNKNTLVFFLSYGLMAKIRPMIEDSIEKRLYWEESGHQKRTMASLEQFKKGRNGVFFTVMSGSIAEGIDFPGDEASFAIVVGIPYPPPTVESKAMSDMFDKRYGTGIGWIYVSEVPAVRKIKQAIGRLIRTETDRGMAVILDSRASRYTKQLDAKLSADAVGDSLRFFRNG
ncbi:MAG: ATP-dependent DNA helicase [Methanomassiliicoccaceae archaeon]|jgi:DNA excision repair protein ERCC-2|nr:ATP-dependent DNA helicase [Methanomassiliicoccaceae archaeon]